MILLGVEAASLIGIILLAAFSETNSNTIEEKITYGISFSAVAGFMIFTALKMKEAKKWAWVSAIIIFVLSLGGPFFPFAIAALVILFRKNIVAYFTQAHIPPNQAVNQSRQTDRQTDKPPLEIYKSLERSSSQAGRLVSTFCEENETDRIILQT